MRRMLVEYDPVVKRRRDFHFSSDGKEFVSEARYDVEDVVETNKALHAGTDERCRWGDLERVASIPLHIYFQMKREGKIREDGSVEDERWFLKWLDDSDQLKFRTRPGSLSK